MFHRQHGFLLLLSVVLLLSLWRLGSKVVRFGDESLQMDLSAFYTAGEALNHGLSPYQSYVAREPMIWDGVDLFQHSRFLYPPQVAALFRPLARLPYAAAKRLWMGLSLAAVGGSLVLTGQAFGLKHRWALILLTAIGAALFYPLLTHLERGQIDALTGLLLVGASVGLSKRTSRAEWASGVLLCAATLLKLHCVYMWPFLAIRKKGRALLGCLAGGALIAVLTAVAPGGIKATLEYVQDEMPRIARFGEWGTDEMRVPEEVLKARLEGLPEASTIKDGVVYKRESFSFVSNGTLVRVFQRTLQKRDIWITNSQLSVLVLAMLSGALLLVMGAWRLRWPGPLQLNARGEFLYWQVMALIVLLTAPLTWVMNLVWLLPLMVVVLAEWGRAEKGRARAALVLAAAALVLIALPDGMDTPWMAGPQSKLLLDKYVIGEGLLLASLLGYMPHLLGDDHAVSR